MERGQLASQVGHALLGLDDALGDGRGIADVAEGLNEAFVEEIPLDDLAAPVGGDDALRIMAGDDLGNEIALVGGFGEFVAVDVPDAEEAVVARGDNFSVRGEGDALHASAMGGPVLDLFTLIHFPDHDGAVRGTGGQDVGVRTPGDVVAGGFVLSEDVELTAVGSLPDHDIAIAVRGGQQDAIGAELGAEHPFGVLADGEQFLTGASVVAFHLFRGAADGDHFVIRADVSGLDLVEFLADFGDALAGLHVPNNGVADFSRAAATHDEKRSVAAELQAAGIALLIREDADELPGAGVVEQDLFRRGDGEQRGPRTESHGGESGGARRDDDGLQQDVLRLGDGAFRLPAGDGHGHVHLRFAGFLGDGRFGLQHASLHPQCEQVEILGAERGTLRRHEGLLLLRAGRPEAAAIHIAGIDDGTAATAGHESTEAGEIEVAFFLVRAVAGEALVLQHRADMVFVRDFFGSVLGVERHCGEGRASQREGGFGHHRGDDAQNYATEGQGLSWMP